MSWWRAPNVNYKSSLDAKKWAAFSTDGKHRYLLGRRLGQYTVDPYAAKTVLWCMLNPSKANHETEDATIRRCVGFTKDWGYEGFEVVNLYTLVETDSQKMLRVDFDHRIGPANSLFHDEALRYAKLVVCAWGANIEGEDAHWRAFVERVKAARKQPMCLGRTAAGHPKHPLRLARNTPLEPFE